MSLYKNKYRIEPARMPSWDYGTNAAYFVTICTYQREEYFGNIKEGVMHLSALGKAAHNCWLAIPEHFAFVNLDVHVVMPNHLHGIFIINKQPAGDTIIQVLQPDKPTNLFGPQSQNLASIIRGYKIGVTKEAKSKNAPFRWQSRFHEHVIRDHDAYLNIRNYILTNPENWEKDKFYTRR